MTLEEAKTRLDILRMEEDRRISDPYRRWLPGDEKLEEEMKELQGFIQAQEWAAKYPDYPHHLWAQFPLPNTLFVWEWDDAPEFVKELSCHGGDEDWVLVIPPSKKDAWVGWAEGGSFGCCRVQIIKLPDDTEIRIGAHA